MLSAKNLLKTAVFTSSLNGYKTLLPMKLKNRKKKSRTLRNCTRIVDLSL